MNWQLWIAIGVGLAACVDDLARRRISNWISAAALAGGLAYQTGTYGWSGVVSALLGTAAGFGVFLVFYCLGGMGGGDVKLMAGFGSLLGAGLLFQAALWTAGCGGLIAAGVLAWRRIRRGAVSASGQGSNASESIPYAPAIAIGVLLALAGQE